MDDGKILIFAISLLSYTTESRIKHNQESLQAPSTLNADFSLFNFNFKPDSLFNLFSLIFLFNMISSKLLVALISSGRFFFSLSFLWDCLFSGDTFPFLDACLRVTRGGDQRGFQRVKLLNLVRTNTYMKILNTHEKFEISPKFYEVKPYWTVREVILGRFT